MPDTSTSTNFLTVPHKYGEIFYAALHVWGEKLSIHKKEAVTPPVTYTNET